MRLSHKLYNTVVFLCAQKRVSTMSWKNASLKNKFELKLFRKTFARNSLKLIWFSIATESNVEHRKKDKESSINKRQFYYTEMYKIFPNFPVHAPNERTVVISFVCFVVFLLFLLIVEQINESSSIWTCITINFTKDICFHVHNIQVSIIKGIIFSTLRFSRERRNFFQSTLRADSLLLSYTINFYFFFDLTQSASYVCALNRNI